jgi:ABC-type transport system involved in multi-copper enzyme maturation permease subunit
MFREIFRFEFKYRSRRPAFWIYFVLVLLATGWAFADGDLPLKDKEFINSAAAVANFQAMMSIFLMIVSATIMGTPLYRDLEHDTKEYYLSYPITRAGYFWGRYAGSFLFVALVGTAMPLGAMLGSRLGPLFGWQPATRYEHSPQWFYWQPYLFQALPNLFFTSSLFFGLVAVFRNIKVIYSSAMFLFLGYIIANFFLHNINDPKVIYLSDPFNVNGLRSETSGLLPERLNNHTIPLTGLLLQNRLLWTGVGLVGVLLTWWRFDFERFFGGRRTRTPAGTPPAYSPETITATPHIQLRGSYYRRTLLSLTRIEVLNLVRDGYLWIILTGGLIFMSFIFWNAPKSWGVTDYPRTSFFMDAFAQHLLFFLFVIIVFYTGEAVHRERLTRYHFINDTLPPPTWVLNCAKLLGLLCFAVFLSFLPIVLGLAVQGLKGYPHLNLPQYVSSEFISILPKMAEMVLFAYAIHIAVNNKFAAHGIAIAIWTVVFIVWTFGFFDYNLLLYACTPRYWVSDMDGIGHLARSVSWFNFYWTIAGAVMVVLASLFYSRGTRSAAREKIALARQRFHGPTRAGFGALIFLFLAVGGFIYYTVSYENEYLTPWERQERSAITERQLKKFEDLPQPVPAGLRLHIDLYPDKQQESTRAEVMLVNKGRLPIDSLLLDGDRLDFELRYRGVPLPYTCPLYFPRGKFNLFRPRLEASDYRFYRLPGTLLPGDSAKVEVRSNVAFHGFLNDFYGGNILHNGIVTAGNLPGLGYDEDDELRRTDRRKEHGLPEKVPHDVPQDDSIGRLTRYNDITSGLVPLDINVSTSADQWAVAPGRLLKEWTAGGRHYFHYVQTAPGVYMPLAIASARYSLLKDTVQLAPGRTVDITIFYHHTHDLNLSHFMAALKDGLHFYSREFGLYPFDYLYLVETPNYGPFSISLPGMLAFAEPNTGWNAGIHSKKQLDYPYYNTAALLAHQWWGQQVAPNNTVGSPVLSDGLSQYAVLLLMKHRFGDSVADDLEERLRWDYGWGHRTNPAPENDLLHANQPYIWTAKAGISFYDLSKRMGADSLNAALRDFVRLWAFRKEGPYAGAFDLFQQLSRHVPDSLRSWLHDSWEKPGPLAGQLRP